MTRNGKHSESSLSSTPARRPDGNAVPPRPTPFPSTLTSPLAGRMPPGGRGRGRGSALDVTLRPTEHVLGHAGWNSGRLGGGTGSRQRQRRSELGQKGARRRGCGDSETVGLYSESRGHRRQMPLFTTAEDPGKGAWEKNLQFSLTWFVPS